MIRNIINNFIDSIESFTADDIKQKGGRLIERIVLYLTIKTIFLLIVGMATIIIDPPPIIRSRTKLVKALTCIRNRRDYGEKTPQA